MSGVFCLLTLVSNLSMHQNILWKAYDRASGSASLGRGLRVCILNEPPSDVSDDGLGFIFGEQLI